MKWQCCEISSTNSARDICISHPGPFSPDPDKTFFKSGCGSGQNPDRIGAKSRSDPEKSGSYEKWKTKISIT